MISPYWVLTNILSRVLMEREFIKDDILYTINKIKDDLERMQWCLDDLDMVIYTLIHITINEGEIQWGACIIISSKTTQSINNGSLRIVVFKSLCARKILGVNILPWAKIMVF